MTDPATRRMALDNAASVLGCVQRTAVRAPAGAYWHTYRTPDQPQCGPDAYMGAAGISLFLSAYRAVTGDETARELAHAALAWSATRDIGTLDLGAGWAGVGQAWLAYFAATGDERALAQAWDCAEKILAHPPGTAFEHDPTGDVLATDFFRGVAGQGVFLLRLWDITRDERLLDFSSRGSAWLDRTATRNPLGCYWPIYLRQSGGEPPHSGKFTGFFHGSAGIGYFLALLHARTGDAQPRALAAEIADGLRRLSCEEEGQLIWRQWVEYPDLARCQWCHGSAGIGLFYARAYKDCGDDGYLRQALAAGDSVYRQGDFRDSPNQCHGLAGNGEFLLELYAITGDGKWLDRARDFAGLLGKYREGDVWRGDEPGLYTPDFFTGAAGVGHFYLRLVDPDRLRLPLC